MRTKLIVISFLILIAELASANEFTKVKALANANGFTPDERIIQAVVDASKRYGIKATDLAAVGILETGLGKYNTIRNNTNGTQDQGLFQINTVNAPRCIEYNLDSYEGNALCAAKLLKSLKLKRPDYLGAYHSKTPTKKALYLKKLNGILANN